MIEKNCLYCNKPLIKTEQIKFCSPSCSNKHNGNLKEKWNFNIDDRTHQIFEGIMLSDGSLELANNTNYPRFNLSQSDKSLEYVHYIRNLFNLSENRIKYKPKYSKSYNKTYGSYSLTTTTSQVWTPYYKRWYPNGKKVIPNDFKITPLSLLHAYIGDGSLSGYKSKYKEIIYQNYRLSLYIENFTEQEVKFVQKQLCDFNIHIKFDWHKQRNNIYPRLIINKKEEMIKFFDYIGECPVECYKYKFTTREILEKKSLIST